MKEAVVLDATPLGILCHPHNPPMAQSCRTWLQLIHQAGRRVFLPEIVDYEVRREINLRKNQTSLQLLNQFVQKLEYLPLTTVALHQAAELWAQCRLKGQPTASPHSLDADVILSAQAMQIQVPFIIATSNVRHLSQFAPSALWNSIQP